MNKPLLHIFIPVYGVSPFLKETLDSVTKNTAIDVPVTVIEDKSKFFGNEEIVKQFPRVSYIKNDMRLGIAKNFQKCAQISEGSYTQIIGSDDNYEPIDIRDELQQYQNESIDVVIFKAHLFTRRKSLVDFIKFWISKAIETNKTLDNQKLLSSLAIGDWTYFPAIVWSTEKLLKFPFDEKMESAMDFDLKIKLIKDNSKFVYSRNFIVKYRRHAESQSSKSAVLGSRFEEEIECLKIVKEHAKYKNWKSTEILSYIGLTLRIHILYTFLEEIRKGRYRSSILKKTFFKV